MDISRHHGLGGRRSGANADNDAYDNADYIADVYDNADHNKDGYADAKPDCHVDFYHHKDHHADSDANDNPHGHADTYAWAQGGERQRASDQAG